MLEVKDRLALERAHRSLAEAGIAHKLWTEQPEDEPTCLATAPCPKSAVGPLLRRLQLCKARLG